MSHFSSVTRMKYISEANAVRIAIRSSDSHVEEFLIPAPDAVNFCGHDGSDGWFGEGCLRGKLFNGSALLCIQFDFNRRSLYSMQRSVFNIMRSELRALLSEIDLPNVTLVSSQIKPKQDQSEVEVDHAKIAGLVSERLIPQIQALLSSIKLPEYVPLPSTQVKSQDTSTPSTSVFIPSDIGNQELEGKVQVTEKTDQQSGAAAAAAALKRARKGKNWSKK